MQIRLKARLATGTVLAAIGLIAGMIWWADSVVQDADHQRRQAGEIARALTQLRLVTFEYLLNHRERAREQEHAVAVRLAALLTRQTAAPPDQRRLYDDLRAGVALSHQVFEELAAARISGPDGVDARADPVIRRFEDQLASQLLTLSQENVSTAFALTDQSTQRIQSAQAQVAYVIAGGLVLIALAAIGAAWIIDRDLLAPVGRIEAATRQVAAGNWSYRLDEPSDDELGRMAANFDAMTRSLRASFAVIERRNQELAALNQEIEAFSYSVSHDLRGPLRSMDGFSQALLEDYGDKLDEEGKDSLNRIRNASQRMGRLIDELLGLSRVTRAEIKPVPVDLGALARDLADGLAQQAPERRVTWQIDEHIVVQGDRALLQIAMTNLLENAWKFTGRTEDARIRVGMALRDGRPTVFVADNGVGFDMAYADRLFGAFQRLHHEREFTGTGIGLATVHRIIRRHEGHIWAEASPGHGATFLFQLKETET